MLHTVKAILLSVAGMLSVGVVLVAPLTLGREDSEAVATGGGTRPESGRCGGDGGESNSTAPSHLPAVWGAFPVLRPK
jgi:hypothetical protein